MNENMLFYPHYPYEEEWREEEYSNYDIRKTTTNLFTPFETMEYGNLFKEEYVPYLNYQPQKIVASNDKEKRLYKIMALKDYCHDLKLYLDIWPNDQEKRELYQNAYRQYEELKKNVDLDMLDCPGYGPGNGKKYIDYSVPSWTL